jgi:hypothetical protein
MRALLAALWLTASICAAGAADLRDDVLANAKSCAAISDYRQWLDCYYGAAQPLRALLGLPPATAEQQRLSAGVRAAPAPAAAPSIASANRFGLTEDEKVPPQQFGLPRNESAENVDHISARMTAFTMDRNGSFTATLSNGQIWRQVSGDIGHAQWEKSPQLVVYNVTIEHGLLGSYNLRVQGKPGQYKVVRVQ